jgi:peptidoglycan/LPS O-acetylase OafA/YrhL
MKVSTFPPDLFDFTNFCKGIAIAWIVLVHLKGGWFGWQGVHVFIVLSGFGLAYSCLKHDSSKPWGSWFYKRFRRILPVYWVVVLASLPLVVLFNIGPRPGIKSELFRPVLDFFLFTNVFEEFRGGGTGAFWYVPFIIGAYLLFPWFYGRLRKCSRWRDYLLFFLGIAAIEILYRAFAIYVLDGQPIGYSDKFLKWIPDSVSPLREHPDWLFGLFQRRAPFGFIPARMTEFVLGMLAGFAAFYQPKKLHQLLFGKYIGWIGFILWLGAQSLMYVGLWGWIFADFAISLGLIVWLLNLANFCRRSLFPVFQGFTWIGVWSYYIYLTHQPFTRIFPQFQGVLLEGRSSVALESVETLVLLTLMLACVGVSSWLAMQFDRSEYPERMMTWICRGYRPNNRT